ncbi:1,4-dihydroxy-6-naphthoate synthase [Desulfatiferula olefinivorans]
MTAAQSLSLAYSPCPNDTFLFHALIHGLVPRDGLDYRIVIEDVETLNQKALMGTYDISKLSFAALGGLLDNYGLLRSGAALGRGCGPLIVARPGQDPAALNRSAIAVPGLHTTAHLLLGLYLDEPFNAIPMPFDRIMPAVALGEVDFGVIIHEGRFTFTDHGLIQVADLGAFWEDVSGLPIPLGGIAVKRSLAPDLIRTIERGIAASVTCAFEHPDRSRAYVKAHAQELDDSVIRRHIDLYVNSFTVDLGPEGHEAVTRFLDMARQKGLLPHFDGPLYAW